MDELAPINSTPCADLERLAAAAATMVYSSDTLTLPSQIVNTNVTASGNPNSITSNSLPSTIVPQYSSDPYDLSRPHQFTTIRFAEFQMKTVYEPNQEGQVLNQQIIPVSHSQARVSTHYTVIERTDSNDGGIPRTQGFSQPLVAAKNVNLPQVTSSIPIHYLPVDARNISTSSEPLAIAVSQPNGIQIATSGQVNSQPVIHFVSPQSQLHSQNSSVQGPIPPPPPPLPAVVPQAQQPKSILESNLEESSVKDSLSSVENHTNNETSKKKRGGKTLKNPKSEQNNTAEGKLNNEKAKLEPAPEPVDVGGKKYYVCGLCSEKFARKYLFKRHQIFHTGERRGALSLETKAEIINRIKKGEKQVDLAIEYNVGRSTLSFIMKNSEKFLGVLKNGKFHPDSKRLRGAQREDVEAALYEWYKQASVVGITISGPILCRKARDFAAKLGYQEFKATRGWLDRFKRRKHIVLGRAKCLKEKDTEEDSEEFKEDFADIILPNILIDYESNDVFHASEIGLLYKILPSKASQFKGTRCAGGTNSKRRITALLCTNMTGSEKFPLLVIGKHTKPKCFRNVKSLPVQYLSNEKSWMTKENFTSWLTDLNSWFVQQNRKILLVVPSSPIHPKSPKLSAVRVLVSPSNFVGPSKLGIAHALKRNYRRALLEYFYNQMDENTRLRKRSRKNPTKLSLLTCLHKLASAWHAVTDVTISNSFQRSALGKYGLWGMHLLSENRLGTENLDLLYKLKLYGMKMPPSFTFDDYVTFDDEVQVCHFMDDDDIIASVTGADIESSDSDEEVREGAPSKPEGSKEDDEYQGPSFSEVEKNLDVLRNHIAHQPKGSQEMFSILSHLECLLHRTLDNPPTENSTPAKEG